MPSSIVIFDNFLDNITDFRAAALNLQFVPSADVNDGIFYSNQRIQLPSLEQRVSHILQEPVVALRDKGHGIFRLSQHPQQHNFNVSLDQMAWIGILHLTLPENCRGGTEFFRHKASSTDRALLQDRDLDTLGVQTPDAGNAIFSKIFKNDLRHENKWISQMTIPMRFNRLVMYRPWMWHKQTSGFGTDPSSGRLDYLLFLDRKRS